MSDWSSDVCSSDLIPGTLRMENASAIAALASLSYDTRLAAIQLLASAGEEGLAAGEIARRLGVQQRTLSDHLRALAAAGVVIFDRKGRSIIYRANSKTIDRKSVVWGKSV